MSAISTSAQGGKPLTTRRKCHKKRLYFSSAQASSQAVRINSRRQQRGAPRRLHAYKCNVCSFYHLTSRGSPIEVVEVQPTLCKKGYATKAAALSAAQDKWSNLKPELQAALRPRSVYQCNHCQKWHIK